MKVKKAPESHGSYFVSLSITVLAVSIAFYVFFGGEQTLQQKLTHTEPSKFKAPGFDIRGKVPRLQWQPEKAFAEEIASYRRPVILYETALSEWPCAVWSPAEIITRTYDSFIRASVAPSNAENKLVIPMYHHAKNGLQTIDNSYSVPSEKRDMTVTDFWSAIFERQEPLYFSGLISNFPYLKDEMPSDWPYWVTPERFDEQHVVKLWMSQTNTTAPTHYDKSHNFHNQIWGSKRFILSEPGEHLKLNLFPGMHPRRLQSQLDLGISGSKTSKMKRPIRALEAVLHPGDVLYIPPFWFHTVSAISPGIGTNFWTTSTEMILWKELKQLHVPIRRDWDKKTLIVAMHVYIKAVTKIAYESHTFGLMKMRDMAKTQFVKLYENRKEEMTPKDFSCHLDDKEFVKTVEKHMNTEGMVQTMKGIKIISDAYKNKHVRDLELFAFFEELTSLCIGIENLFAFMSSCI